MCVVSMVYDKFDPIIPWPPERQPWRVEPCWPFPAPLTFPNPLESTAPLTAEDVRKILEDFHKAVEAAKVVDKLTGQSDCLDPEKAKLETRVKQLEALLAKAKKKRKRKTKPRKSARRISASE